MTRNTRLTYVVSAVLPEYERLSGQGDEEDTWELFNCARNHWKVPEKRKTKGKMSVFWKETVVHLNDLNNSMAAYDGMSMDALFEHFERKCGGFSLLKEKNVCKGDEESWDTTVDEGIVGGKRLTVGDFDLIPNCLDVNEKRCLRDPQYRRAIKFLEETHNFVVSRKTFDTNKKYRDAINLLIGTARTISCSFNDQSSEDISEHGFVEGAWFDNRC